MSFPACSVLSFLTAVRSVIDARTLFSIDKGTALVLGYATLDALTTWKNTVTLPDPNGALRRAAQKMETDKIFCRITFPEAKATTAELSSAN